MKRKMVSVMILAAMMIAILSGCGHQHEWAEATCTEPKTCTGCGETEGEALGHDWKEATCTEPKTCSRCGQTEGEALGHKLSEANYQDAPVCSVCGETVGEPLEADFEKYNLTDKIVELDKEYDCVIACYDDPSFTTNAKISFSNYQTIKSGIPEKSGYFTVNTELPAEEGYEYKIAEVTIKFYDENARIYGAYASACWEDYYDVIKHDDSMVFGDDGFTSFTANWKGEDYTKCLFTYINEWGPEDGDVLYTFNSICIVRVPEGYDGFVWGYRNDQIEWGEDQHIFDLDNTDTVFFRFK